MGEGSVNPNLYEDGKVCLSLLNTWHGETKVESWNPNSSTFLQILVSLLGLVLVREPYYNEAGYEVLKGLKQNEIPSAQYSERVYFQSRAFIIWALRTPPAPFDGVLRWLYVNNSDQAPDLMSKAIQALKAVVDDNGEGLVNPGGMSHSISKGALTLFKRYLDSLQELQVELRANAQ